MGNSKTNPHKNQHPDQDTLQAYLDQALAPGSSREVEEHLESCPACREKIAGLEKMFTRLETLPEISLHKDFSPGILEMIRVQKQLSRSITWTLVVEGITAGAILGLVIPALQLTPWIPRLLNTQTEIQAGVNIFLAQLFSSWMLWWAQLKFSFTHLAEILQVPLEIPAALPATWIWTLLAVGLGVLINGLLLKTNFTSWNPERKR